MTKANLDRNAEVSIRHDYDGDADASLFSWCRGEKFEEASQPIAFEWFFFFFFLSLSLFFFLFLGLLHLFLFILLLVFRLAHLLQVAEMIHTLHTLKPWHQAKLLSSLIRMSAGPDIVTHIHKALPIPASTRPGG
mgnify:CR=1 FL=1